MVNRSKPKWWKWSERSYWYFAIGINAAVIIIAVSAFFLGINYRAPIITLLGIPILFFALYSPKRIIRYAISILIPAAVGYMTALFVIVFVFETILFPVLTLGFILGGVGGYFIARRTSSRETN